MNLREHYGKTCKFLQRNGTVFVGVATQYDDTCCRIDADSIQFKDYGNVYTYTWDFWHNSGNWPSSRAYGKPTEYDIIAVSEVDNG